MLTGCRAVYATCLVYFPLITDGERPEALLAMNIASLIFRPDRGFLALTSFQSFNRPGLSFESSSRISLRRQSFSVSRPRLRPPGNIHNRLRLLLTQQDPPALCRNEF